VGFVLTQRAARDLGDIHLYVSERAGTQRADEVMSALRADLEHLAQFPNLGRPSDTPHVSVREKVLPRLPYRVIYRVQRQQVIILRVLHTSRRPPTSLQ
jgi:plasmid stabilization system protein ParE